MTLRHSFLCGDPNVTITSQQMEHQLDEWNPLACVNFSHSPSVQVYYALRSRLESCSEAWLQEFIQLDGLDSFLDCLGHMTGPRFSGFSDAILQIDCLSCIRTVLNSRVGMETLVNSQDGVWKLVKGVGLVNTLPRKLVVEILSALCVYNKLAYDKLLKALDRHKRENHMYHRFSFIVNELKMAETVHHKTSVLMLINSIIGSSADVSGRCRIRNEFIGLTLLDVLSFLQREDPDEDLYIQLQAFQEKKHEDESVLDIESNLDLSSPQDLADAIQARVFGKPKMVSFVNILQDLLAIEASEKEKSDTLWQVLERHIHHIVHGIDDIDSLSEADTETACRAVTAIVGRNFDTPAPSKKLSQIDVRINAQEKPSPALDRDKRTVHVACSSCVKKPPVTGKVSADSGYIGSDDKFSPPSYLHSHGRSPVKRIKRCGSSCENQNTISLLGQCKNKPSYIRDNCDNKGRQISTYDNMSPSKNPDTHRKIWMSQDTRGQDIIFDLKLQDLVKEDGPVKVPDKANTIHKFGNIPRKVDLKGQSPADVSRRSPTSHHNFLNFQRNKLAFPAYVMRNLKWIKLDESCVEKYSNCVWVNTEACQLRIDPDFLHLEEMFREKYVFDESSETPLLSHRTRLSLNLFLNRLDEDPVELVKRLACIEGPGLPLPFIKHLVDNLPEHSEIKHLKYFNGNLLNLGGAEQFVLHLLDLPDYRTLLIGQLRRAEFATTVPHLRSVLDSMLEASRTILSSKSLQETLVLVLRLGNFLNHGQYNGYAGGFKLSSLARLTDLKSREPGHNFIHFLVSMVDSSDDKLLDFLAAVPLFEKAASCSPAHIKTEFDKMNGQINSFIRQLATADPFTKEGFNGFLEEVKKEFRELQSQITELKFQSQQLAEYFCESEAFEIQICFRQLLDFFKQLRLCRQEVQLMKRQKKLARQHSTMFTEQIRTKHMALKFGQEAGASSSMLEEKRQIIDHLVTELHRGNFNIPSTCPASPFKQPGMGKNRLLERVMKTPSCQNSPVARTATPDRNLNLVDLSHISLLGTPMMNRPKSELFDDDITIRELNTGPKIVTSSVRHLADIAAPPSARQTMEPPVFSLQNSLAGSLKQRNKTHHRSKSDLADSISATTKWIRYHQQARWDYVQAPLARPESSITLATLSLEAGKRHHQAVALVAGPTIELPRNDDQADPEADVEMFGLVRNGKKGERRSGTFSNFLNKISKRVLRQRSSSDQNTGGNVDIVTGETGLSHVEAKGDKIQHKADKNVSKGGPVGRNTGVIVTGKGSNSRDKENVCDIEYNPFDRQKKNPVRLSNRFKGKSAK